MIRLYRPEDREPILDIARREGRFPTDPADPIAVETVVAEEDGRVVGAIVGRATIEPFLYVDPSYGSPRSRWATIKELWAAAAVEAVRVGAREVHIFIPPELASYAKGISKLPHVVPDNRLHFILNPALYAGLETSP